MFADQGWKDLDDMRALPRSAIIGTVELRGVHPAVAVRAAGVDPSKKDWIGEALENAVRDPAVQASVVGSGKRTGADGPVAGRSGLLSAFMSRGHAAFPRHRTGPNPAI